MASDEPRGMHRPVTRWQLALAVVAAVLLTGTTMAWAGSPQSFTDVGPAHPFFSQIEWMNRVGVSEGYPDGTYRPADPVTRQAMSAFMQRLYDVQDDLAMAQNGSSTGVTALSFAPLAGSTVALEVPPGTSAHVVARYSAESICFGSNGYCRVRITIDDNNDGVFQVMHPDSSDAVFDSSDANTVSASNYESHALERSWTLSRGCTCQVRVEVMRTVNTLTFGLDDWMFVVESDLLPSDESFGP